MTNQKLDIALGKSRETVRWKNEKWEWDDLRLRLAETQRTHESLTDYMKLPKGKQDQIKDVGGFVGGYLRNGKRGKGTVKHRQILTLDIDQAEPDLWDRVEIALQDLEALVYSTHKHSIEAPRLRLVMPLTKPVQEEQYEPLARKIAERLGMDQFDQTSYRPTQLMYWPSTAKDGEFLYRHQGGDWLNPDDYLDEYPNGWQDTSAWPRSAKEAEHVQHAIGLAGDPLDKPGMVGAFCRTRDVHQAIADFLADVYEGTDQPNRYTFKGGSTSAGLVVYNQGRFAFSNHGTDPASEQLCNAWDLVRIHKFGGADTEKDVDLPINQKPSQKAMLEFAAADQATRMTLGRERIAATKGAFKVETGAEEEPDDTWMAGLDTTKGGDPKKTIDNIYLILENDPRLKGRLRRNLFSGKETVGAGVPWKADGQLTDGDINGLLHYLEHAYRIDSKPKILTALDLVLREHSHHPVKDYLNWAFTKWDGFSRVERLLVDYLGAEDTAYTRAVTRKTLAAACARIQEPGCKFDYVLTLVGKQGAGKSTFVAKLGGDWYSDNLPTVQGKEGAEQIQGVWIMEMGELAGIKKAEVEIVKHFISRQEDSYRPAYGIKKVTYPRQCIFIGTTNTDNFLRDSTGNRRFWPVKVDRNQATKDPATIGAFERAQIWGEAMAIWANREDMYLSRELEDKAREQQEDHSEEDDRTADVIRYLETPITEDWDRMDLAERRAFINGYDGIRKGTIERTVVSVAEIWAEALDGDKKGMNNFSTKPIHDIMRKLPGWEPGKAKRQRGGVYGKQTVYIRKNLEP